MAGRHLPQGLLLLTGLDQRIVSPISPESGVAALQLGHAGTLALARADSGNETAAVLCHMFLQITLCETGHVGPKLRGNAQASRTLQPMLCRSLDSWLTWRLTFDSTCLTLRQWRVLVGCGGVKIGWYRV